MAVSDINSLRERMRNNRDKRKDERREDQDQRQAQRQAARQQTATSPAATQAATTSTTTSSDGPGTDRNLSDVRARLDAPRYDSDPGNILSEYVSDDNRLMRLAATEGRQSANRRGMLNSSIAAGASMDAMARTALPLAQQQSQQIEARNLREEAALFEGLNQERAFGFESQLSAQGAEQQGELSAQEAAQQGVLMKQEYGYQGNLAQQEQAAESRLQGQRVAAERELAQLDADTRTQLMEMEESMRVNLANLDVAANERADALESATAFGQQYQESMRSILNNPDLPADERNALLENAGTLVGLQTDMVKNTYGVDVTWSDFSPTGTGTGRSSATVDTAASEERERNAALYGPLAPYADQQSEATRR